MCSHVGGSVPIEVQGAEEGVWGAGAQPPAGSRGGAPGRGSGGGVHLENFAIFDAVRHQEST